MTPDHPGDMAEFTPEIFLRIENIENIERTELPTTPDRFPWERTSALTAPLLPGLAAHHIRLNDMKVERGEDDAATNKNLEAFARNVVAELTDTDGYQLSNKPPTKWRINPDGSWHPDETRVGLAFVLESGENEVFAMDHVNCRFWMCLRDPEN